MNTTKARWSGSLSGLAESFAAFFPISFVLFVCLFLGQEYIFPWLHEDLHGKEAWLNVPFLFSRNAAGLLILYGLGFAYLYQSLWFKVGDAAAEGRFRKLLKRLWDAGNTTGETRKRRMNVLGILYILAFAVVLAMLGFDMVMAMDPHWYSTLFGGYTFVKAVYVGLGALIILAALVHLSPTLGLKIQEKEFHDAGKLFFAFCLVWADFFYCQLVVIWYGNIAEETSYVIERTMLPPWQPLAWTVFIVSFAAPFLILLSKSIKTRPKAMLVICTAVIVGIWLEHLLLIGPAMNHHANSVPLGIFDVLIFLGFSGLMALAVTRYLSLFPELILAGGRRNP
jgi:hypothetical protein